MALETELKMQTPTSNGRTEIYEQATPTFNRNETNFVLAREFKKQILSLLNPVLEMKLEHWINGL